MAKKKEKGKISGLDIATMINNIAGERVSYSLDDEDNPSSVKDWIPTGSRVLDGTIAKGMMAGIPVGRITSFAGMPSTGKSFIACSAAAQAQKKGYSVVYYDTESSLDPSFLESIGIDIKNFTIVDAPHVEMIFETINAILDDPSHDKTLFIWDSLAATQTRKEMEDESYNPQAHIALRPRIVNLGLKKLFRKLPNSNSALLITNQLYTNIPTSSFDFEAKLEPFVTPGGTALKFAYSLEIWLTRRKAKSAYNLDQHGGTSGAEVIATIKKSRFGTERRQCAFDIEWGAKTGFADKESWLDIVLASSKCGQAGAWYTLTGSNGQEYKFQAKQWLEKLQDPEFFGVVDKIMNYELIDKYLEVNSSEFSDVESKMSKMQEKITKLKKLTDEDE